MDKLFPRLLPALTLGVIGMAIGVAVAELSRESVSAPGRTPATALVNAEKEGCFNNTEPLPALPDVSEWTMFRDSIIEFKYPANLIRAEKSAADLNLHSKTGKAGASVSVKWLSWGEVLQAVSINALPVSYNARQGTWWKGDLFDPANLKECIPNSVGATSDGRHIFKFSDGDVGAFYTKYLVLHGSRVVEISTAGDGNDPDFDAEFYPLLDEIVQTLNISQ